MRSRPAQLLAAWSLFLAGGALLVLGTRTPLEPPAYAAQTYSARGVVQSIAADRSSVTIAHDAIPGFMPAMTMSFGARSPEQIAEIHVGDRVTFSFTVTDDARRLLDSIHLVKKPR